MSSSSSSSELFPQSDVIFVVEGTALCGNYQHELIQTYILPALEYFNGGPLDESKMYNGLYSINAIYGIVIFHAADVLPGALTEANGPITNPHEILTTLETFNFAGGHGEAKSYVGEGLAASNATSNCMQLALQCLEDITFYRNSTLSEPARKQVILICNCEPYDLPVTESVGENGIYRGLKAKDLALKMDKLNIHFSILAPRKITALITLFLIGGGNYLSQGRYAMDARHLILLNGFVLSESPASLNQAISGVPNYTPPSGPSSQSPGPREPQASTSTSVPSPSFSRTWPFKASFSNQGQMAPGEQYQISGEQLKTQSQFNQEMSLSTDTLLQITQRQGQLVRPRLPGLLSCLGFFNCFIPKPD